MKRFLITETYTGFCEVAVEAETEKEAIKLYENGEYDETEYVDDGDRYDYKFYSIEEDN
ncbi:MAG: hypothetical protein MK084_09120 [Prochlorococcus sp. ALOHA_A2.0_50]|nr:hypothetical protein [Prochlorococcus sp. ALOHA_A2.0_50]